MNQFTKAKAQFQLRLFEESLERTSSFQTWWDDYVAKQFAEPMELVIVKIIEGGQRGWWDWEGGLCYSCCSFGEVIEGRSLRPLSLRTQSLYLYAKNSLQPSNESSFSQVETKDKAVSKTPSDSKHVIQASITLDPQGHKWVKIIVSRGPWSAPWVF